MVVLLALLLTASPLTLSTSPRHIYVENDARDGKGPTESFIFRLVVRGGGSAKVQPSGATVRLLAGTSEVKTVRYGREALEALREKPGQLSEDVDARGQFRFAFDEPVAPHITSAEVRFEASGAAARLTVPITAYAQKTPLLFPLAGDFVVVTGHVSALAGHQERSQQFAYDVLGLGPHLELLTGPGTQNADFVGFGRKVVAPAAGTVVYARNDVADNPATGNQDFEQLLALPDPPWGVGGNCVVIDHGNGEWSFLAHLEQGSVVVKTGDHVSQGAPIGQLGNSGATTGPHLHYHLMNGPRLFTSDGLPAYFGNTCTPIPKPGIYCDTH